MINWNDDPPPPPRKGDLLVQYIDELAGNACLNPASFGEAEHKYKHGYWRGARLLVQHAIEYPRDQEYLAYPIIFLYRHHIELALKNIVEMVPGLVGRALKPLEEKSMKSHKLDELWKNVKQICDEIQDPNWGKLDTADLEGIDDYIRQLCELDPYSESARYRTSKKGFPCFRENTPINLQQFDEMMNRLADWLDTLDMAISHVEEVRAENRLGP